MRFRILSEQHRLSHLYKRKLLKNQYLNKKDKNMKTLKSKQFGSFISKIYVQVEKSYADIFQNKTQSLEVEKIENHVIFLFKSRNLRHGDDEYIIYELGSILGLDVPSTHYKILWDRSDY